MSPRHLLHPQWNRFITVDEFVLFPPAPIGSIGGLHSADAQQSAHSRLAGIIGTFNPFQS